MVGRAKTASGWGTPSGALFGEHLVGEFDEAAGVADESAGFGSVNEGDAVV